MKATIVAAVFVVFYVFATPSVAAPLRDLPDSEIDTREQILGAFGNSNEHLLKKNCYEIMTEEHKNESGVYSIRLGPEGGEVRVYCDMVLQGGGWTVIMRRTDGSENFDRNWEDYAVGFGGYGGEFFQGLSAIHALTNSDSDMELWIGLRSHEPVIEPYRRASYVYKYAHYGNFRVSSHDDGYMVTVSNYDEASTAGDSFTSHSGAKFSTKDRDNDNTGKHCAQENHSGWWFYNSNCHDSNLAGIWKEGGRSRDNPTAQDGIMWHSWKGDEYSLREVIMAIRPVSQE